MKFGATTDSLTKKSTQMEDKKKQYRTDSGADASVQNELVIHRVFEIPAKKLWQALTSPEEFKKWWGPKGFECPYSNMESRVGGKYLSCMRGPDGKEYWSTGVVQEFVPEKKLVITDHFSDKNGNIKSASEYGLPGDWPTELQITFELEEVDGATKLMLTHEGIPDEMYEECKKGWNESFDKLEENIK